MLTPVRENKKSFNHIRYWTSHAVNCREHLHSMENHRIYWKIQGQKVWHVADCSHVWQLQTRANSLTTRKSGSARQCRKKSEQSPSRRIKRVRARPKMRVATMALKPTKYLSVVCKLAEKCSKELETRFLLASKKEQATKKNWSKCGRTFGS